MIDRGRNPAVEVCDGFAQLFCIWPDLDAHDNEALRLQFEYLNASALLACN